ncbi:MAG: hypothetical protein LUG17_03260 [Clostridiales bacterium]|nr:hypothetical protein [Clostridiales bacterium]
MTTKLIHSSCCSSIWQVILNRSEVTRLGLDPEFSWLLDRLDPEDESWTTAHFTCGGSVKDRVVSLLNH